MTNTPITTTHDPHELHPLPEIDDQHPGGRINYTYYDGTTVPGTVMPCGCIRPDDAGETIGWHLEENHQPGDSTVR
jgi:hypothetical protein